MITMIATAVLLQCFIVLMVLTLYDALKKKVKIHEHNNNVLIEVILELNERIEELEKSNEQADKSERATLD